MINYLDGKMVQIYRRYGKKFSSSPTDKDDTPGYTGMDQVVADIDPLLDVAWISGTRKFYPQSVVDYLLSFSPMNTRSAHSFSHFNRFISFIPVTRSTLIYSSYAVEDNLTQ